MEYGTAVISEEQRRELLRYLEDRRGGYLAKLAVCGIATLFFGVLSAPVFLGLVKSSVISYRPRGSMHDVELEAKMNDPDAMVFDSICEEVFGDG